MSEWVVRVGTWEASSLWGRWCVGAWQSTVETQCQCLARESCASLSCCCGVSMCVCAWGLREVVEWRVCRTTKDHDGVNGAAEGGVWLACLQAPAHGNTRHGGMVGQGGRAE